MVVFSFPSPVTHAPSNPPDGGVQLPPLLSAVLLLLPESVPVTPVTHALSPAAPGHARGGVPLGVLECVTGDVGEGDGVREPLGDDEPVIVALEDGDAGLDEVTLLLPVLLGVPLGVPVPLALRELLGLTDAPCDRLDDGVVEGEALLEAVPLHVGDGGVYTTLRLNAPPAAPPYTSTTAYVNREASGAMLRALALPVGPHPGASSEDSMHAKEEVEVGKEHPIHLAQAKYSR